jgi:hypothetical protein
VVGGVLRVVAVLLIALGMILFLIALIPRANPFGF